MVNQRYYITCPICRAVIMLGKSLGDGVYQSSVTKSGKSMSDFQKLNEVYDWMWKHMTECHEDETREGILFTIESDQI